MERREPSHKGKSNIYPNTPTLTKQMCIKLSQKQWDFVNQQPMTKIMYIRNLIDKEMTK